MRPATYNGGLKSTTTRLQCRIEDVEGMDSDIDPRFRMAAELLGQAVFDASFALKNGAVDYNLIPYGGRLRMLCPSSVAKCSMLEAIDACRFLTNGRAARLLAEMESLAGRTLFPVDFLHRCVRDLAAMKGRFQPRRHHEDVPNQVRDFKSERNGKSVGRCVGEVRVKWTARKGVVSHGSGYVWVSGKNVPSLQVDEAIRRLTRAGIFGIGSEFTLAGDQWTSSGKITSKNTVEEKLCLK